MDATQPKEKIIFPLSCAVHRLFSVHFRVHRSPASPAEREDAMKTAHGIPCNDYRHISKAKKNRITYRFVTNDGITPSACTVRLGDTDPLTGQSISDKEFFMDYFRMVDHEIYVQGKETRNRLSLDAMVFDDGDNQFGHKSEYSVSAEDPFNEDTPEDILRLREVSASLTGRLVDVYEALLINHAGGKEKISLAEIAKKWSVSTAQVYKDKGKIIRMIREAFEKAREETE